MGGQERRVRTDAHLLGRLTAGLVFALAAHGLVLLWMLRWSQTPVESGPESPPPPAARADRAVDPCAPIELSIGHRPTEVFGPDPSRHHLDFAAPRPTEATPGPWPVVVVLLDDTPTADPVDPAATGGDPPLPADARPPLLNELARHGYAVAAIRLQPETGPRLSADEVGLAVRWLKSQGPRLHLQSSKIGIVGGQVAAQVAFGDPRAILAGWGVSALDTGAAVSAVALSGLTTLSSTLAADAWASGCAEAAPCSGCAADRGGAADLLLDLGGAEPATLIVSGTQDCAVPSAQARRLHDDLKALGTDVRFRGVSGVVRPADLLVSVRQRRAVEGFLNETLRGCVPVQSVAPILSEEEVDRLIALAAERPPEAPPVTPPKPDEKRQDKQIVEIPPPENPQKPENARFQSEYNSKVEKEMVSARNEAPTPRVMKSELTRLGHGEVLEGDAKEKPDQTNPLPPSKAPPAPTPGDAPTPGEKPGPPNPEVKPTKDRTPAKDPSKNPDKPLPEGKGPFKAAEPEAVDPQVAAGGGKVGGGAAPVSYKDLLPSLGKVEQLRKDGSIDYIENIDRGERTALNTDEYKHAWFFNRVKSQVQQRWRAVEAHRRYDPYGRVYGVRDRLTVVQVTLNADGTLDDLHLDKDSGVGFLDDSALQAFREAQPFPHPPDALRDADGRIRFKFSFFLEINGGGMRMFRAP